MGVIFVVDRYYSKVYFKNIYKLFERVQKKILRKHFLYKIRITPLNIEEKDKFFIPLDINILNKMYEMFKEEFSEEKYEVLKSRIDESSSDKTFVVLDKHEKIYGYYSMSFGNHYENEMKFKIPKDEERAYLFDSYTFKSMRGNSVQLFAIKSRLKIAESKGYKYAMCIVMDGNIASEKNVIKAGFEKSGTVNYYHFKKIKKTFIKEWD